MEIKKSTKKVYILELDELEFQAIVASVGGVLDEDFNEVCNDLDMELAKNQDTMKLYDKLLEYL